MNKRCYIKPELTTVLLEHRTPFLDSSQPESYDPDSNPARQSLFSEDDDFIGE